MEFSMNQYEQYLSTFLKRKYGFIESVDVVSLKLRMGTLYGEYIVTTQNGTIYEMTPQCKEKHKVGDRISFWSMAICFRKKFALTQIEKDMELIFWEMLGQSKKTIGSIKTEYIIN
jgi:hypothetical protein